MQTYIVSIIDLLGSIELMAKIMEPIDMSRRKLLVKNVYDPKKMLSLVVNEEEPIKEIIKHFVKEPSCRGIFVIDEEHQFKGAITRSDLLKWAKFKLGKGIPSGSVRFAISEIRKFVYSTVAKDVINRHSHNAHVKPEHDVITALDLMMSQDIIDVPVVNERGKILGDLKLTEILNKILEWS